MLGLIYGMVDWSFAALFYLTAYGLGTALTAFTLIIEDLSFHRYDTFRDRAHAFLVGAAGEPRLPPDDGVLEASRPLEVPAWKKGLGRHGQEGIQAACRAYRWRLNIEKTMNRFLARSRHRGHCRLQRPAARRGRRKRRCLQRFRSEPAGG